MDIIPAIDIIDKKVVRLKQGRFEKSKVYSEDPVSMAKKWAKQGARILHIVDLDGARAGKPVNTDVVRDIAKAVEIDIELGGGLRSQEDVEGAFRAGVRFAVIGTSAVKDEALAKKLIERFGDKIIFAVDVKNGKIAVKGWVETSEISLTEYISKLASLGAKRIIYTDISRDGMMTGPSLETLRTILRSTSLEVTASGGISKIEDIEVLKELEKEGLKAVITGKALYEGKLDLGEAIKIGGKNAG